MDPFPLPLLLASDKPQTRNYSNSIFAALPFGDPALKSFPRSCAVLLLAKLNGIEIQLFVLSDQRSGYWPILSTEKVTSAWIYFGEDGFFFKTRKLGVTSLGLNAWHSWSIVSLAMFLAGQAATRFLVEFVYFELGFWFLESASRLGLKGSWKLQMPREWVPPRLPADSLEIFKSKYQTVKSNTACWLAIDVRQKEEIEFLCRKCRVSLFKNLILRQLVTFITSTIKSMFDNLYTLDKQQKFQL